MKGYAGGVDWVNAEAMKYWVHPASYSAERKKTETREMIFSGNYYGAIKVDGYYERLIKDEDGNCFMIARNRNVKGESVDKVEWVPQLESYFKDLPNGTVLLAECYLPNNEGSKKITSLLGCLKDKCIARQKDKKLHFYVFDIMAYNNESYVNTPFADRINELNNICRTHPHEYVEYAEYFCGEELWNKLQMALAEGREGMVIMRSDAKVYFKRTPARVSLKIKKELTETIDCFVIGVNPPTRLYNGKEIESWKYWEDCRTGELHNKIMYKEYAAGAAIEPVTKNYFNKWAGSLKLGLMKNGEEVYFGDLSGLTEEILGNWKDYIGKVVEVGGMEIDKESGHIRHPRFMKWREDKTKQECDWNQVQ